MRLCFSRRVLKNPVYLAYTIFQVLPKKQNIANYRRFNKIKAALCSAAFPLRLLTVVRLALAD